MNEQKNTKHKPSTQFLQITIQLFLSLIIFINLTVLAQTIIQCSQTGITLLEFAKITALGTLTTFNTILFISILLILHKELTEYKG